MQVVKGNSGFEENAVKVVGGSSGFEANAVKVVKAIAFFSVTTRFHPKTQ